MAVGAFGCVASADPAGSAPPPIVLISLDTLRADRLGAYGQDRGLTPNLDRFAREAVVFEDAVAPANETLFSHAALFTGRDPPNLGELSYAFSLPEGATTLAEVLSVYGYDTAGFVAGGHLDPDYNLDQGFAAYHSVRDWGSLYHTAPAALTWLDGRERGAPYFLFVHSYDAHARYLKPGPFGFAASDPRHDGPARGASASAVGTVQVVDGYYYPDRTPPEIIDLRAVRPRAPTSRLRWRSDVEAAEAGGVALSDDDVAWLAGLYDGAVHWADAWFGLLMSGLQARGVLDQAIVVVLSDHGEELGEDGVFNHRYTLSDAALRVPLMVRLPGGAGGGVRVSGMVSLTDVAPTLLEAAGARPPAGLDGRSVWAAVNGGPPPDRDAVFSIGVFRTARVTTRYDWLAFSGITADSPYFGAMVASARLDGPAFEAPAMLPMARREALRGAMVAWAAGLERPASVGDPVPAETLRAMQEHGYWGPQ